MLKPNIWFILLSEVAIGGLCIFFFFKYFLQPNAKSKAEEMEERMRRYDEIQKRREAEERGEEYEEEQ